MQKSAKEPCMYKQQQQQKPLQGKSFNYQSTKKPL